MASKQTVWDLPTRLFHWLLVLAIALLWYSGEFGGLDITLEYGDGWYWSNMDVHAFLGQCVLVLLIFRLLWGLFGSTTSRFRHFVYGAGTVLRETGQLLRGRVPGATGHTPLGGWMIVALIALLLLQGVSGLFAHDDLFFSGPLNQWVDDDTADFFTTIHHRVFAILQILILLHIAAVFYYLIRGNNLIAAMITGKKPAAETDNTFTESPAGKNPASEYKTATGLVMAPNRRALTLVLLSIGVILVLRWLAA